MPSTPSQLDLPLIKSTIHTFLTTLSDPQSNPLESLLPKFTTSPAPLIHEHGLPSLAPFLGRDFVGQDGIKEYFLTMGGVLGFEDMRFEDEEGWIMQDMGIGGWVVVIRGWARFFAKRTGEGWREGFVYRLRVVREDGEWKIQEYRVWADTGAAYLALRGELGKLNDE
ncbi:hypothetical protein BO94DRAFT_302210 [Aspergillus sclerotioniger CBS 115572]|uniref:SnoaL-like domain-containing protein n=1 Tax=Aspergillus sclerotioniger CBS 115572 TaxID=1450535 RepID=A0A317V3F5_9EURO|nr:hypothetical protein BO94DRAFT_302210 [Aspergillus sclerotioniger CBS 115572]PWY68566.1 hypothetical protein BO94DRAFT_302210 [Aspergillus sclerotioniger CBS 115572]